MAANALLREIRLRKKEIKENAEHQREYRTRSGEALRIQEDPEGGVGGSVWDAALRLLETIELKGANKEYAGKTVVDLGSGTGLAGLLFSLLGAGKVYLTDRAEIIPLLKLNVSLNPRAAAVGVEVEELEWGAPLPFDEKADIIVASECIYNMKYAPVLLQTIELLSAPHSVVFFAYASRNPELEAHWFASDVDPKWSVATISSRHDDVPHPEFVQCWQRRR